MKILPENPRVRLSSLQTKKQQNHCSISPKDIDSQYFHIDHIGQWTCQLFSIL